MSSDENDQSELEKTWQCSPSLDLSQTSARRKRAAKFAQWHKQKLEKLTELTESQQTPVISTASPSSPKKPSSIGVNFPCLLKALTQQSVDPRAPNGAKANDQLLRGASQISPRPVAGEEALRSINQGESCHYPYILCVICDQWVCLRNRFMHIESHLQYRPYKCSQCGYSSRKEILVKTHQRYCHQIVGEVLFRPESNVEKYVWQLAMDSMQYTTVRMKQEQKLTVNTKAVVTSLERYPSKSLAIMERLERSTAKSPRLGLSKHSVNEEMDVCRLCNFVLKREALTLGDHVRLHMPEAVYHCPAAECEMQHASQTFLQRHMKESHRLGGLPPDPLDTRLALQDCFLAKCVECFPNYYTAGKVEMLKGKLKHSYDIFTLERAKKGKT